MKRFLLSLFFLFSTQLIFAQKSTFALDENSIIRDSTGKKISKIEYFEAITSGNYQFKPIRDKEGKIIEFLLVSCAKGSNNTKITIASSAGCIPRSVLQVGNLAPDFEGKDLADSIFYDFNYLKGEKIIVLNFWFTKCPPCIAENEDLNHLVEKYKSNSNIIFLAPTFEFKESIDRFLEEHPFKYTILPEAISSLKNYKILQYPTHVVIDRNGRIAYISTGGIPGIEFLLDKALKDLLKKDATIPAKETD